MRGSSEGVSQTACAGQTLSNARLLEKAGYQPLPVAVSEGLRGLLSGTADPLGSRHRHYRVAW